MRLKAVKNEHVDRSVVGQVVNARVRTIRFLQLGSTPLEAFIADNDLARTPGSYAEHFGELCKALAMAMKANDCRVPFLSSYGHADVHQSELIGRPRLRESLSSSEQSRAVRARIRSRRSCHGEAGALAASGSFQILMCLVSGIRKSASTKHTAGTRIG
jgi:hypothetical protein